MWNLKILSMKSFMSLLFILFSAASYGQDEQLMAVFNDQVDAYNKGDVKRLVDNVSDDFKWFYITADTLLLEVSGKENFRKSMEQYFSAGHNSISSIEESAVDGNRISFKEVVHYKNKKGETVSASAMGIYELKDDKIFRVWYFTD